MAAAIELIIIPTLLMMTVIVAGVWSDSPIAAVLFAAFVIVAVINIVRFAREEDLEEHVDTAPNFHDEDDEDDEGPPFSRAS